MKLVICRETPMCEGAIPDGKYACIYDAGEGIEMKTLHWNDGVSGGGGHSSPKPWNYHSLRVSVAHAIGGDCIELVIRTDNLVQTEVDIRQAFNWDDFEETVVGYDYHVPMEIAKPPVETSERVG